MAEMHGLYVTGGYEDHYFKFDVMTDNKGYTITNIEGIGPECASQNFIDYAVLPGSLYNMGRMDKREITITIALDETIADGSDPHYPEWTGNKYLQCVTALRLKLYRIFPINKTIRLRFDTEHVGYCQKSISEPNKTKTCRRVLGIDAVTTSIEPVIFTNNEYVTIKLVCPYPYFKGEQYDWNGTVTNYHELYERTNVAPIREPQNDFFKFKYYDCDAAGYFYAFIQMTNRGSGTKAGLEKWRVATSDIDGNRTGYLIFDLSNLSRCLSAYGQTQTKMAAGNRIVISTKPGDILLTFLAGGKTYDITGCITKIGYTGSSDADTTHNLPTFTVPETKISIAPYLDNNSGDTFRILTYMNDYYYSGV